MQIAVGGTLTVPHLRGALSASHETRASPWPAASLGVHLLDEGTCAPLLTDRTFQAMEASVRFIDVIPVASGQQELVSYRPSGGLGLEALCGSGERRGPSDPGHHPRLRFSLSAYEKLCRHGVCTCPCGSLHESACVEAAGRCRGLGCTALYLSPLLRHPSCFMGKSLS